MSDDSKLRKQLEEKWFVPTEEQMQILEQFGWKSPEVLEQTVGNGLITFVSEIGWKKAQEEAQRTPALPSSGLPPGPATSMAVTNSLGH